MNPIAALLLTLTLLYLLNRGLTSLEKFRKKKYHREYMRKYRWKKRLEKKKALREWRGKTIKVNDKNKPYYIVRNW